MKENTKTLRPATKADVNSQSQNKEFLCEDVFVIIQEILYKKSSGEWRAG